MHHAFADSGNWCLRLRKNTDKSYSIYFNIT